VAGTTALPSDLLKSSDLVLEVPHFLPQPVVPVLVVHPAVHHRLLGAPLHGDSPRGLARPGSAWSAVEASRLLGQPVAVVRPISGSRGPPAPAAILCPSSRRRAGFAARYLGDGCGCGDRIPDPFEIDQAARTLTPAAVSPGHRGLPLVPRATAAVSARAASRPPLGGAGPRPRNVWHGDWPQVSQTMPSPSRSSYQWYSGSTPRTWGP
jgi:hypothetical protein